MYKSLSLSPSISLYIHMSYLQLKQFVSRNKLYFFFLIKCQIVFGFECVIALSPALYPVWYDVCATHWITFENSTLQIESRTLCDQSTGNCPLASNYRQLVGKILICTSPIVWCPAISPKGWGHHGRDTRERHIKSAHWRWVSPFWPTISRPISQTIEFIWYINAPTQFVTIGFWQTFVF